MSDDKFSQHEEASIKGRVAAEIERAKKLAKELNFEKVKSGQWFLDLLRQVIRAYNRNARAEYFRQKYPGLPPDEIADILTSVVVRYATIAGAIAGAAATANQVALLSSAGMTAALFVTSIGGEMIYLAQLQMRLVLDLSVVYDLQLDPDDPEDILMIFGYALGVTPTELLGKGLQIAAGAGVKGAIRKYISKGTLKAIQDFARRVGFKILQRTIIKYAVPVASAAVGSTYNYVTTTSVGRIAKAHLKNRGKVTDELRSLVSRQNTYDLVFPAAVMYVAQVDGEVSAKEHELYRAMLSRMSFDDHTQAEFQRLVSSEENVLEAMAQIEDEETRASLTEMLVLMAVYDGRLADEERAFLTSLSERLAVHIDIEAVEQRAQDYKVVVEQNVFQKTAGVVVGAASGAVGVAGHAAESIKTGASKAGTAVKDAALAAGGAVKNATSHTGSVVKDRAIRTGSVVRTRFRRAFRQRRRGATSCPSCGRTVPAKFAFCPDCGQPTTTDRHCSSCGERVEVGFSFCPHCGAAQDAPDPATSETAPTT